MSFAAFDPTSQKILFVGAQGFDGSYAGLYVIGVDGTDLGDARRTDSSDAQVRSRIAWSPDGTPDRLRRRFEPGFVDVADRGWRGRSSTTCAST